LAGSYEEEASAKPEDRFENKIADLFEKQNNDVTKALGKCEPSSG
jgi:hypothetical protein